MEANGLIFQPVFLFYMRVVLSVMGLLTVMGKRNLLLTVK